MSPRGKRVFVYNSVPDFCGTQKLNQCGFSGKIIEKKLLGAKDTKHVDLSFGSISRIN